MSTIVSDDRASSPSGRVHTSPPDRDMTKPYIAIVDDDSAFASYLRTFLSLRGDETDRSTRRRAAGRHDARPRRHGDAAGAQGDAAGGAGHHAVRPQSGLDDC